MPMREVTDQREIDLIQNILPPVGLIDDSHKRYYRHDICYCKYRMIGMGKALFLSVLILTACGGNDSPPMVTQNEIGIRRTVWENRRASLNYTIEYSVQCFCIPIADRIRVITNSLGQKTLVELLNADGEVFQQLTPAQDLSEYLNIEEFFARLTNQWANAAILNVTFDEIYGYPTSIFVNANPGMADGELTYEIALIEFF